MTATFAEHCVTAMPTLVGMQHICTRVSLSRSNKENDMQRDERKITMSKRKTRLALEAALEFVERSQAYILAANGKMFEASVFSMSTDLDRAMIERIQNAMKMVETAADTTKVSAQVVRGAFDDLLTNGDKPRV